VADDPSSSSVSQEWTFPVCATETLHCFPGPVDTTTGRPGIESQILPATGVTRWPPTLDGGSTLVRKPAWHFRNQRRSMLECVQKLVHEILCQRRESLSDSRSREHVSDLFDNLFRYTELNRAEFDEHKPHSRWTLAPSCALKEHHAVENCADLVRISAHPLLSGFSLGTIPPAL
jgi:hypothetical protein